MTKPRKKRVEQAEVVRLFAARLREVRRSRGMTQAELARKANVTASYVWRLEAGVVKDETGSVSGEFTDASPLQA